MASALIGGLLAKGFDAGSISVIERFETARENLVRTYGVRASAAPDDATRGADTLLLAVKPQDLRTALAPVAAVAGRMLVISIVAGVRLADISRWLAGHDRIVRSMPNTPALIGAGVAALYAPPGVAAADRARAERILGGRRGRVGGIRGAARPGDRSLGSGPAYVFWFIEQLAQSGVALGLAEATARKLALQTVLGAAQLAARSGEPASVLRERVTSKGGTTEAALRVFDEERLAERLRRALEAASRRSTELGEQLGKD
jgi:pyrroline-5-carboxylate reductase